MKLGLTLFRVEAWFGENFFPVIDMIEHADRKGIDIVHMPAHIVMGTRDLPDYPYMRDSKIRAQVFDENTNFPEPVMLMSWIGSRTTKIRLSTFALLARLCPAALLAKQLATLDVLTRGRIEAVVGVGWQKIVYDAEGLAWEGRFVRMIETVEACKRLWTQAPASYSGKYGAFEDIYCRPFPVQAGGPPSCTASHRPTATLKKWPGPRMDERRFNFYFR